MVKAYDPYRTDCGGQLFYYKEARFGEAAGKSTKYRKLLEKKRIPHRNRSKKIFKKKCRVFIILALHTTASTLNKLNNVLRDNKISLKFYLKHKRISISKAQTEVGNQISCPFDTYIQDKLNIEKCTICSYQLVSSLNSDSNHNCPYLLTQAPWRLGLAHHPHWLVFFTHSQTKVREFLKAWINFDSVSNCKATKVNPRNAWFNIIHWMFV